MKHYFLFFTAMIFLLVLCSCKKEKETENNDTTLAKISAEEISTPDMNDVHTVYGTLIGIQDLYNPEEIANINDDNVLPIGVTLTFKLNQQVSDKPVCVLVNITDSIGIDGKKIMNIKNEDEDYFFLVGTDAVIEYYGELEDLSDDTNHSIYHPDSGIYNDSAIYKINYIKSISNVPAGK